MNEVFYHNPGKRREGRERKRRALSIVVSGEALLVTKV